MDGLGLGGGTGGVEFGFSDLKKIAKKAVRVAVAPVVTAHSKVLSKVPGGGLVKSLEKKAVGAAKKAGNFAVRKAAQYAAPALAVAAGAAAAAGCTAVGIPGPICALPAAKLGAKAGAALSKRMGVSVKSFPAGVDPVAVVRGDPGALMVLGKSLASKAGVPVTPREAIFLASRKAGLPPEVTASARFLARKGQPS